MDNFANIASSGGFAISETGGKALIQAIHHLAAWVDDERGTLVTLAQQPKLGSSNGAQVMKPYIAEVASDGNGFMPMLLKFRESLGKAEQAINDAMNNYRNNEHEVAASLKPKD
jgi:hypothetical protein